MTGHPGDIAQLVFWSISGLLTAFCVILLIRPVMYGASSSTRQLSTAITWAVPALALTLYIMLGRPDLTRWHTQPDLPPFIAASVDKLTTDVEKNPTDTQGWILLGDVYAKIRRYDEAASAYRRAAELDPKSSEYAAMVGEMLVKRDGDAVDTDAQAWFAKAKDEPLSRYYMALATAQAGDWQGALSQWQSLESSIPADAPWRMVIDQKISQAKKVLGLNRR